jgi:hypothetical protein
MALRTSVAVAAIVWLSAGAIAAGAEREGVRFPERVDVEGTPLVLNGLGVRKATFMKVKVYVAGLYLPGRSSDARSIIDAVEPKRIELAFVRGVGQRDIVKAFGEGFEKSAGAQLPTLRGRIAELDRMMPAFHEGDRMTFTHVPGRGVTVEVNGVKRGNIAGDDFARALFGIWLGPKPPNESLRDGLLGH